MVKFEKRKAVNPAQLEAEEEDDTDDDQPQSKEKDQAERVALSKAFWFAIAGVSEPKK